MMYRVGIIIFMLATACGAQDSFRSVNSDTLNQLLKDKPGVLLDVRTVGEFSTGHLKDAVLLDFMKPEFESELEKLDKSATYYVYCRSGNRSAKAASLMNQKGFQSVYNVADGMIGIVKTMPDQVVR
ncbi:MAG TPA: rhodanese-like domain-containing protein [bacterium]|nr:rhodanese-like domain-containing protein [bacterium]HNB09650.1 rhodanese-like domain-containing protein [bacterium]HNB57621.1 rhodanese-like domain-containing protein [bacterium]HND77803.1 rhodanese-like domain-containing protein [bacterium]HNE85021.1 rhodanese-like domain-containing protein [bacterium]